MMTFENEHRAVGAAPVDAIVRLFCNEVNMKISEMIDVLESSMQLHGDIGINVTWEGTLHEIDECNIYLSKEGVLYIDADENFYKNEFSAS